ncbi:MAG: hypothetical protein ACP5PT_04880 [Brevinematia bacterium]
MNDDILDEILEVLKKDEGFISDFKDFDLWLPLLKYKLSKVIEVTKNLDHSNRSKAINIVIYKTRKFILELERAVRDNYYQGENDIIKAIVKVLIKDVL